MKQVSTMKQMAKTMAIACMPLTLSACIYIDGNDRNQEDWRERQDHNMAKIQQLTLGSARENVSEDLGAPDYSEAFSNDEGTYHILYYRTQHLHADGYTSKEETTPLVFRDNRLLGWGQTMLDSLTP